MSISFRFVVRLESEDKMKREIHGLLFHRWLPSGYVDAIEFDTKDENIKFKIWFQRFGFLDNNFIRFSYKKKDELKDDDIIKQGVLESGPLFGEIKFFHMATEEIDTLKKMEEEDQNLIKLSKKIINDIIYPHISKFISFFRLNYGQYWLPEFEKWDSRFASLGTYCQSLELKFSLDDGVTWNKLIPDKAVIKLESHFHGERAYLEYLTINDWQHIPDSFEKEFFETIGREILVRAYEFYDIGNFKYALIEGVTALEIAVKEYVQKIINNKFLENKIQAFYNLPLESKVIILSLVKGNNSIVDVENTCRAYELRNRAIHDGRNFSEDEKKLIKSLIRVTMNLLDLKMKLPKANCGNAVMSPERWGEGYGHKNA